VDVDCSRLTCSPSSWRVVEISCSKQGRSATAIDALIDKPT